MPYIYLRSVPSDADRDDMRLRDPTTADAGGSVVGTLSATLGALLLVATGLVAVGGTGSGTLGTLTLSGTGAATISGTLAQSLGAVTCSGTGEVTTGSGGTQTFMMIVG
jgi:hypothetical protein